MAIDHKFANTVATSIQELLQTNVQLKVPRFQRHYSWDKERVWTLWNDLYENFLEVYKNSENEYESQYLLGPIVLTRDNEKPKRFFVIDGQQRLATITMLFCVARDIILDDLKKRNKAKPDGFEKIQDMIQNTKMDEFESWKLELNDMDKNLFKEIQEYEYDAPRTQIERLKKSSPKRLIHDSYEVLHDEITKALDSNFGKEDGSDVGKMSEEDKIERRIRNHKTLLYFLTYLRENNYLIKIVSDDSTAFQIFETLNERGQTLSKSDLIKNHILSQIKSDDVQKELNERWNAIFDNIVGSNQRDDKFVIESYQSRLEEPNSLRFTHDITLDMSKNNLYKIIKRMVKDETSCKKLIKELAADNEFLSMLNDPNGYSDDASRDEAHIIKALNAKFIRVPMLAAYRKWYDSAPRDYSNLVKFLVKFFFKTRVVRQERPGEIEKIANRTTKMINNGKSLGDIIAKLKTYDNHVDFQYNFKHKFMPSPSKDAAKYVLQQITLKLGTELDDMKPIDDLALEYILPIKHDAWNPTEFLDGDQGGHNAMDEFAVRLGNMTLLEDKTPKIRNLTFLKKKNFKNSKGVEKGYSGSDLEINRQTVCNHDKWTANIIKRREAEFARLADEIWRL